MGPSGWAALGRPLPLCSMHSWSGAWTPKAPTRSSSASPLLATASGPLHHRPGPNETLGLQQVRSREELPEEI